MCEWNCNALSTLHCHFVRHKSSCLSEFFASHQTSTGSVQLVKMKQAKNTVGTNVIFVKNHYLLTAALRSLRSQHHCGQLNPSGPVERVNWIKCDSCKK